MMNTLEKNMVPELKHTGERWIFEYGKDIATHDQHMRRYEFACEILKGQKVLDAACGAGYGSYMLAKAGNFVTGIDISEEVIQYATQRYASEMLPVYGLENPPGQEYPHYTIANTRLTYLQQDVKDTLFNFFIFDAVVCFETIEHIEDYGALLKEMIRVKRPEAPFIVSTPNIAIRKGGPIGGHHTQEWSISQFKELMSVYFESAEWYGQLWDGTIEKGLEERHTFIIGILS